MHIEETVSLYAVSDGSLADGVLEAGDIIVSAVIKGTETKITRQYHIIDIMLDLRVGDKITINLIRDGKEKTVDITITEECLTAY